MYPRPRWKIIKVNSKLGFNHYTPCYHILNSKNTYFINLKKAHRQITVQKYKTFNKINKEQNEQIMINVIKI